MISTIEVDPIQGLCQVEMLSTILTDLQTSFLEVTAVIFLTVFAVRLRLLVVVVVDGVTVWCCLRHRVFQIDSSAMV